MEKEKPTYKIERRKKIIYFQKLFDPIIVQKKIEEKIKNKNQNLYNRQRELRKQVPDFDLKIEIPNNLKIKDQKNLN